MLKYYWTFLIFIYIILKNQNNMIKFKNKVNLLILSFNIIKLGIHLLLWILMLFLVIVNYNKMIKKIS